MTAEEARRLFWVTGLPEAYVLSRRKLEDRRGRQRESGSPIQEERK